MLTPARFERFVPHEVPMQGGIGADTLNHQLIEGLAHPGKGGFAGVSVADHLGDQ